MKKVNTKDGAKFLLGFIYAFLWWYVGHNDFNIFADSTIKVGWDILECISWLCIAGISGFMVEWVLNLVGSNWED